MQHQNSVSYPLDYLYKPVTKSRNIRCPSFSAVAHGLCPSGLLLSHMVCVRPAYGSRHGGKTWRLVSCLPASDGCVRRPQT